MKAVLLMTGLCIAGFAKAQHVENIFVERYHEQQDPAGGEVPLVTYRIFIDLPEDYRLLMVFGEEKNELSFNTTTEFYNEPATSVIYADKLKADKLNTGLLALDSWLTIGAASNQHLGVPLSLDTDGSILECPPYDAINALHYGKGRSTRTDICTKDGLLRIDSVPPVMAFRFEPGYLNNIRGSVVHTMSGAWGVMGGSKGATPENLVLIAQLSTTGQLSFAINIEVIDPTGKVIRLVHGELQSEHEVVDQRLRVSAD